MQGVYAAALTPRRRGLDEIDQGAVWDLIDFLCGAKVDGIVLFGSTGEFVHFAVEERTRVIGLACKRSRVPVAVNVSHSTLDGAVKLAQAAAGSGAKSLVLMPPYFFRYDQDSLLAFYRRFLAEVDVRIPVLLYHIPFFTNPLSPGTIKVLLSEGYAGIKDSSGDWENYLYLRDLSRETPFTLMMGSDGLYARAFQEGPVNGVISGVASAVPELLGALNKALVQDASDTVAKLHGPLTESIACLPQFPRASHSP